MPSTKPPKGTRDILPRTARRRRYIKDTIEAVYEEHGFEPLETPSFERLDTLLGKYGDEGDQLIFRVMKRGADLGRALAKPEPSQETLADLGLRYDLTVPLARVVAQHRNDLPRHFRRYQIQSVWRADRPQKGRYREFTQCDADIVGSSSLVADVEVLSAAGTSLKRLGFDDVVVRVNHRDLLFGLIEAAGIPAEQEGTTLVALDKLDKVGWEGVLKELDERGISEECAQALKGFIDGANGDSGARLSFLKEALTSSERGSRGVAELQEILEIANGTEASAFLQVDPCLARGLSYYTGLILEANSPRLAGSLSGGGRYNNLVGMFSKESVPAVGFSLGLDRLELVMEELGLFPDHIDSGPDAMVVMMQSAANAMSIAGELRKEGISVEVFPEDAKFKKQIKHAESRGIKILIIAGPDEVEKGIVSIKNLAVRSQVDVARSEMVATIRGMME